MVIERELIEQCTLVNCLMSARMGQIEGVGNNMQYSADATSKAKALVRAFLAKHLK